MERKIKFICNAVRWFDKINGNTYHSVRVERVKDGAVLVSDPMVYGYGSCYEQTALKLMEHNKWIPPKYRGKHSNGADKSYSYQRENNYPILFNVHDGLKREMKANVIV